jgi:tripartite ATP-independent transporter DctM subunit
MFIFCGFLVLLLTGLPVAFCFALVNLIGAFIFWGGEPGLRQLILSIADSVSLFALLPIPLFILMGEVMFHSGVAPRMLDALDKCMGKVPGRLALLAVGGGTIFAALSGTAVAGVAMLGSLLVPDMEQRGYRKPMTIGPIMASGSLAIMIPPSALAVLLASLGQFSVRRLLIAIIFPGLLMAIFYAGYIIIRCIFQPNVAPSYDIHSVPLSQKIIYFLRYVLPLGSIVFIVVGLIFMGVATPTESAALGVVGCAILAAIYSGLTWSVVTKTISSTLQVSVMIFLILTGSTAFSQILAFSGASRGLVELVIGFNLSPIMLLVAMQIIMLAMGTFMEATSIMMVTLPIFMPIAKALGFNPVWFGAIMLLNMEMG